MNIDSIKNGIVVDHIRSGESMELYRMLGLDELDCQVAIIKNAVSRKMGRKDMIKIAADIDVDLDVLGYIDPNITVNIIRNGELVEKRHAALHNYGRTGARPGVPAHRPGGQGVPLFVLRDEGGKLRLKTSGAALAAPDLLCVAC